MRPVAVATPASPEALAGHGIAFESGFDVAADVSAGRLVLLFPEWYQDSVPPQLVFLRSRFPSYRQRRLIEFLQARFAAFDADYPLPG
ncbi:LysR family transcriptional regulator [Cupriavidus basilensis OR16]|uniref:LysR family transcriptional regulator n=1 Tax=Cupriavidus basilensis OR16 TaxID=1127483 RepID=H1SIA0_9BURK|nr:LysR family transcriptional regulator [Cupriavidus basilensis]EHP37751.1 LysR family transcriptional regulator [Cupriavidus basilensis OR16]